MAYIDSTDEVLDRFVLMRPWLLEVLKRFFARANDQSLQNKVQKRNIYEQEWFN